MKKLFCLIILCIQASYGIHQSSADIWPPQVVKWKFTTGKDLIFVAVHHTNDMNSPTHQCIREIFENEKPDLYLMEGFSSDQEGESPIRLKEKSTWVCEEKTNCPENLYGAYLATKNGVAFIGADISEKEQIPLMKAHGYSREDVIFYMLVQQLPQLYRDGDFETHTQKLTAITCESMCDTFLQKNIAEWINESVDLTYQDFLNWWQLRFQGPLDMEETFFMWEKGVVYSAPNNKDNALYTQKIAFLFTNNRDNHLINIIKETVCKNKKTLIIYGSSHLKNLWKRLIDIFGTPFSVQYIQ